MIARTRRRDTNTIRAPSLCVLWRACCPAANRPRCIKHELAAPRQERGILWTTPAVSRGGFLAFLYIYISIYLTGWTYRVQQRIEDVYSVRR